MEQFCTARYFRLGRTSVQAVREPDNGNPVSHEREDRK